MPAGGALPSTSDRPALFGGPTVDHPGVFRGAAGTAHPGSVVAAGDSIPIGTRYSADMTSWPRIHDTFLEVVDALPALVEGLDDVDRPALGEWNLRDLVGHLYRAVETVTEYLAAPEPTGAPLEGAAEYLVAYLEARDRDPDAVAAQITARARDELAGISPAAYPRRFLEAAAAARAALQGIPWDRKVASRMGPIRIADYLRTRSFEATVHGLDLARARGTPWRPPDDAVADALVLLTEVARRRGLGPDLLLALVGRTPVDPRAIPVLR